MAKTKPKKSSPKRNSQNQYSTSSNNCQTITLSILIMLIPTLFLLLFFFSPSTLGFQDYLYYNAQDIDTSPIIDYISGDKDLVRPKFITEEGLGPRVVEFYAPWCGHCVHFRPHYIDLAKRVQNHPEGRNVKFYAVSCTVHKKVCNEYKIEGYPSVFAIPAGKTHVGEALNRKKMDNLMYILEQVYKKDDESESGGEAKDGEEKDLTKNNENNNDEEEENDQITSFKTHAQSSIYSDAALSFHYALQHSIYMHNGPLSKEKSFAFRQWIDLLLKTLPSGADEMKSTIEKLHKLRLDTKSATAGQDSMLDLLEGIKENDGNKWSTCRKDDQYGYTCGLWDLFHIMTIGFEEYNFKTSNNLDTGTTAFDNKQRQEQQQQQQQQLKGREKQITARAASKILRNYIEHFFGCRECRANFLREYDDCRFNVCHLNNDKYNTKNDDDHTKKGELALWLWEMHNGVNVRLLREEYEDDEKEEPTLDEEEQVMWPSRKMCGECWREVDGYGGRWNREAVYQFLKATYWPRDNNASMNDAFKKSSSLDRIDGLTKKKKKRKLPKISQMTPLYLLGILAFLWYLVRKREKDAIGRRKKDDIVSVNEVDYLIL